MSLNRIRLAEADRRHVIAMSGGCCNKCKCRLFIENQFGEKARLGDDAHIIAASDAGPRGKSDLDNQGRSESDNVILLCKNCHAEVDQQPEKFDVCTLLEMRDAHYKWVESCLGKALVDRPTFHYLSYINVPRADMYAAANSIALPDFHLGGVESIRQLGIGAGRLMAGYVNVLNCDELYGRELDNTTELNELKTGQYWYSPKAHFRSRKVRPTYELGIEEEWRRQDCIIYRQFDDWRLICMIDPRWITTSTAFVELSSGSLQTVALMHIAKVDMERRIVWSSPLFLGSPEN